ncbi:SDR family oxidoreductase [Helicobacter cinaedi]|uniref:3-oxoacyl-[acyl-carrier-protein] reductase n=1 Tax=Helicobacter cinaedi CCUG 18818 = ATCC BAA-847 TaxID=537971 RepID=A0AAI8MGZ2_9HELI|nr:SDR family oxidoreductase [Helicobacter cinaedi]EFR46238.1 oxidoreductase, short chain dehydrogenase/reductase family protein [Helicobacter cinaedi CCUG 18818 = ATCC BAA-847]QOQ90531.1 SDR family oxidoreductase [Helicobacter cinaedi]BAM31277.1 3-oxoacyl-[acyl-carrier-protein] reductase [Helicobacter cinaedi CCUG 18818 = ATCC BAA-847]
MLKDKNIVITGCNKGIGKAALELCAKNGANIIAMNRTQDSASQKELENLVKKHNVNLAMFYADFSNEAEVMNAANEILKLKVALDGIVNNVGIVGDARLFSMTKIEEIKEVFQVNFFSPLLLTQRLLKNMIRHKSGSIVNLSSVAALDGIPGSLEYVSSKTSLIGATKKLASELAPFHIRVNALAPSITDTNMPMLMSDCLKEKTIQNVALKRMATPNEIAEVIVFLLSSKSSFINGEVIRVDGGKA